MTVHSIRRLPFLLLPLGLLHASRSGLNNVPTADVSAPRVAVVHVYSAFGPGRDASFLTGVRTGWEAGEHGFEAGVDSRWEPGPDVPGFLNAKWRLPVRHDWPVMAFGVAGVALSETDRHRLGQPQSYAVMTENLGGLRLSAGYAVQARNNAWFAGFDRAFTVLGRKLVLRGDALEIQDHGQWLLSLGATYRFNSWLGVEVAQNRPVERGRDYSTAKLGLYLEY